MVTNSFKKYYAKNKQLIPIFENDTYYVRIPKQELCINNKCLNDQSLEHRHETTVKQSLNSS